MLSNLTCGGAPRLLPLDTPYVLGRVVESTSVKLEVVQPLTECPELALWFTSLDHTHSYQLLGPTWYFHGNCCGIKCPEPALWCTSLDLKHLHHLVGFVTYSVGHL